MPKRASTITSASRLQAANWESESVKSSNFPPDCSRRRSISRQSGLIFSRLPTRTQRTSQPISSRKRAAATPSPPLLPGPQNSTARPSVLPPARSLTARATAQAAASISCTEGIPRSSMAVRSISRICAAVAIFIADHAPLFSIPAPPACRRTRSCDEALSGLFNSAIIGHPARSVNRPGRTFPNRLKTAAPGAISSCNFPGNVIYCAGIKREEQENSAETSEQRMAVTG